MNQHLSEKEFAVAIVNGFTPQESQHVANCSQCAAELEAFQGTVASFRSSFRELVDAQLVSGVSLSAAVPQRVPRPIGLWGLAAAMIAMVIAVPVFHDNVVQSRRSGESSADTNPDALMRSIQAHLSRTVPGPMEPILIFVRNHELDSEQRGVQ
jgi:anti-sigma factor RsiW